MSRKRLLLALTLGLVLVIICAASALAADDALKFNMELSATKFTEPKTITVSITVTNAGEGDMPGPVTLYYPSGKQIDEFGSPTLSVGASRNWSGEWTVTEDELKAGKISFQVHYPIYNDNGELVEKKIKISKRIQYSGAEPKLTVERSITPGTAQKGQEISVAYEITNTGDTDVTAVTIKENSAISSKSGVIDSLPAGETAKYVFTAKMGSKDMTSAATITYKAGGKSYSTKVEEATVKYGEVKLSATLTADKKGGAPGDTVKLTLKLKNSGSTDFTNVTVTDDALGTVFSGETVPAGKTVELTKDLTITETQDLQFIVHGDDGTGTETETATGRVKVTATDPGKQIVLRVEASADREQVYIIPGGVVRFTITVYNDSAVDVKNISVKAVETTVYTIDELPAGGSRTFTRDMEISMAGSFQFRAVTKDQLDQQVSFPSNIIPIAYAAPTAVPTEAPLVTPPAPQSEPMPTVTAAPAWIGQVDSLANILKFVFAGIAGVLGILLLIGAIRRAGSKSQSRKAMDHLDGANYRDYSAAPRGKRRSEIISGEEEKPAPEAAPEAEDNAQGGELMAETLQRLYNTPEKPAEEKPETVEPETVESLKAEAKAAGKEAAGAVENAAEAVKEAAEEAAEGAAEAVEEAAEKAAEAPAEAVEDAVQASRRRRAKK